MNMRHFSEHGIFATNLNSARISLIFISLLFLSRFLLLYLLPIPSFIPFPKKAKTKIPLYHHRSISAPMLPVIWPTANSPEANCPLSEASQ